VTVYFPRMGRREKREREVVELNPPWRFEQRKGKSTSAGRSRRQLGFERRALTESNTELGGNETRGTYRRRDGSLRHSNVDLVEGRVGLRQVSKGNRHGTFSEDRKSIGIEASRYIDGDVEDESVVPVGKEVERRRKVGRLVRSVADVRFRGL